MEQVDAVVVGAGAGGGIVAKELAVAGLRVMLLDRGPSFTASDFGHDELFDSQECWNPHRAVSRLPGKWASGMPRC